LCASNFGHIGTGPGMRVHAVIHSRASRISRASYEKQIARTRGSLASGRGPSQAGKRSAAQTEQRGHAIALRSPVATLEGKPGTQGVQSPAPTHTTCAQLLLATTTTKHRAQANTCEAPTDLMPFDHTTTVISSAMTASAGSSQSRTTRGGDAAFVDLFTSRCWHQCCSQTKLS
jgi:hypothetical protein